MYGRLLADAKFLHQRLSALKNVGAPSGMLETVIAEKNVGRHDASGHVPGRVNIKFTSSVTTRTFKSSVIDQAPNPTPVSDLPSGTTTLPNGVGKQGDINGRVNARLSSLMSPPAKEGPREGNAGSSGFKNVEALLGKESSPLPSPPSVSGPAAASNETVVAAAAAEAVENPQVETGNGQPANAQSPEGGGNTLAVIVENVEVDRAPPATPPAMEGQVLGSENELPPLQQNHS